MKASMSKLPEIDLQDSASSASMMKAGQPVSGGISPVRCLVSSCSLSMVATAALNGFRKTDVLTTAGDNLTKESFFLAGAFFLGSC